MIKFFQKIRQQLLTENLPDRQAGKIRRYLLYAVGEIALVMIGILLALEVNNWNENRKDSNKEQLILSQLKEEYETDLTQLEQKISHRTFIIQSASKVLKYIDKPMNVDKDSLLSHISVILGDPTFDPIKNDLVTSGNLRLIKNRNLKRLLTTWTSDVVALQEIEKEWSRTMWEYVVPNFITIGILRDAVYNWWNDEKNLTWILEGKGDNLFEAGRSYKIIKSSELLKNKELEGIMSVAISLNQSANIQSQVLRIRILELLELLNTEIKGE
ncbi:MAG: DUF6090 family protein [Maribacter sp.]|nr:DUF6090 family protein [Maribacter sp.]